MHRVQSRPNAGLDLPCPYRCVETFHLPPQRCGSETGYPAQRHFTMLSRGRTAAAAGAAVDGKTGISGKIAAIQSTSDQDRAPVRTRAPQDTGSKDVNTANYLVAYLHLKRGNDATYIPVLLRRAWMENQLHSAAPKRLLGRARFGRKPRHQKAQQKGAAAGRGR